MLVALLLTVCGLLGLVMLVCGAVIVNGSPEDGTVPGTLMLGGFAVWYAGSVLALGLLDR